MSGARVSFARTRNLTDVPAMVVGVAGVLVVFGLMTGALVLLSVLMVWFIVPKLLGPIRSWAPCRATPSRRLVAWMVTVDLPRAAALMAMLAAMITAGDPRLTTGVFLAVIAVYLVPRLALPVIVGPPATFDTPPGPIVLQEADAVGDFVMATPVMRALAESAPGLPVTWLVRQSNTPFLEGHPLAPNVVVDPTVSGTSVRSGHRPHRWRALVRALRPLRAAVFVNLWDRDSFVYHLAAWRAGIPWRAGNLVANEGGWSYNAGQAIVADPTRHEVEWNLAKVSTLGLRATGFPPLWIGGSREATASADAMLARHGVDPTRPFVALSPATSGTNKRHDARTYAATVRHVRQACGVPTVILGGPGDGALGDEIVRLSASGAVSLAGQTSVSQLAAIIARSRLHIGCDSGPAHVAAAVGTPSVVIVAAKAQKPMRWGPWMVRHRIVRARSRCLRTCRPLACPADDCVRAITAGDICAAVDTVWHGGGFVEPRDGRRSWAVASFSPIVHSSSGDIGADGGPLATLGRLRDAGFVEYALVCPPASPLARAAQHEGFDVRPRHLADVINLLVEFDGGPVLDYDSHASPALITALSLARPRTSRFAAVRIQARTAVADPGALIDSIMEACRTMSRP